MSTKNGRTILKMSVQMEDGRKGLIHVFPGDQPRPLAQKFVKKYNLDPTLERTVEQYIRDHTASLRQEPAHDGAVSALETAPTPTPTPRPASGRIWTSARLSNASRSSLDEYQEAVSLNLSAAEAGYSPRDSLEAAAAAAAAASTSTPAPAVCAQVAQDGSDPARTPAAEGEEPFDRHVEAPANDPSHSWTPQTVSSVSGRGEAARAAQKGGDSVDERIAELAAELEAAQRSAHEAAQAAAGEMDELHAANSRLGEVVFAMSTDADGGAEARAALLAALEPNYSSRRAEMAEAEANARAEAAERRASALVRAVSATAAHAAQGAKLDAVSTMHAEGLDDHDGEAYAALDAVAAAVAAVRDATASNVLSELRSLRAELSDGRAALAASELRAGSLERELELKEAELDEVTSMCIASKLEGALLSSQMVELKKAGVMYQSHDGADSRATIS